MAVRPVAAPPAARPPMRKRWFLGLVATLVLYLGLSIWFGFANVVRSLGALPWWCWVLVPALVAAGYLLLFQRWQFYLRQLGHPLAWRPSSRIYVAGLALVAAPGRSGEALRGLWLQRRHGIPMQIGVGVTLAERVTDLAGALLVLAWGLGGRILPALAAGAGTLAVGAWLLTHPAALRRLEAFLDRLPAHRRWHGLTRLLREALGAVGRMRRLLRPWPLLVGTALAALVWLIEATALMGLLQLQGDPLALTQAAVIRTAMALGGVLSFLPAGVGTAEATAIGLAVAFGVDRPAALAVTLVLRVCTVLLPTAVGLVVLGRHRDGDETMPT
ncbi:lysylphosphatidylglycerol synthase transmembrane domain-containing protein [Cyanobium gracile UHCC 0139]|uniref:Lysylphosphatidylglycerol synthase transmembrane domain-containing protein n=1 Tax=Cyanobium gracile UHCC 0139 TaxID=3110308 RepID=A0ABU5RYF9_9CYAN|nr:lysylphosphatidylglycerol synthase transmembrane domain-containing protein [Cyanobium gracile]MEA5392834.1 lysylphosphatidylglycerol synthase transmembrane domain-containing protein [Cyanobium gracile UHCC 0139]